MLKKVAVLIVIFMLTFSGAAFAASGEVILDDTLYGALVGGLLGGAWYLLDQDDASKKFGTGIGIGIIGGFVMGITDATAALHIEDGEMKYAMPQIYLFKGDKGVTYTAHLLEMNF